MWPFGKKKQPSDPFAGIELPPLGGDTWQALWDRYVPDSGQADTIQGELIRAARRLNHEIAGNGCMNWDRDFEIFCEFASAHLGDGTFPAATTAFVRKTFADAITLGRWYVQRDNTEDDAARERLEEVGPAAEPESADLDKMEQLAELWCRAHPEPIPRAHDPQLDR